PQRVGLACEIHAVPGDATLRWPREGGQDPHEGRLARAIRSEQPEHAGAEVERDAAQRLDAATIPLVYAFDRKSHGFLAAMESLSNTVMQTDRLPVGTPASD